MCHLSIPVLCQSALQFLGGQAQVKLAIAGNRDAARFFGNDDGQAVALLRDAQGRAVAQAERFRDVVVVGHGQDAACRLNAFVRDNHGAVVERTVLEEDVFDEALVDVGIDGVARFDDFAQGHLPFDDDKRALLLLAHAETGHHDWHDFFALAVVRTAFAPKDAHEESHVAARADAREEMADFLLEEDDEGKRTHIDDFIQNASEKTHFKYLRHQNPYQDKDYDAREDICRAGSLHQPIDVV